MCFGGSGEVEGAGYGYGSRGWGGGLCVGWVLQVQVGRGGGEQWTGLFVWPKSKPGVELVLGLGFGGLWVKVGWGKCLFGSGYGIGFG